MPISPGVLEADVAVLRRLGVEIRNGRTVRPGSDLEGIREKHNALVLATGSRANIEALLPGARSLPGVFIVGNAASEQPTRLAVRSIADGRRAAQSVASFLAGSPSEPEPRRFDSRRAVLSVEDLALLAERSAGKAAQRSSEIPDAVVSEALRCLDCDCLRGDSCRLRRLADDEGLRHRLGAAAATEVNALLSPEKFAKRVASLIDAGERR